MYQIACEDPIIHTSASPVCSDGSCPCHGQRLVTLLIPRLEFIMLGTGKVHARDKRNAAFTCCGRDLLSVTGAMLLPERSQCIADMCGRCVSSLRTYSGGQVRIEEDKS